MRMEAGVLGHGAARRSGRPLLCAALLAALGALLAAGAMPVAAQKLFKYRDANGVWVFTDRRPDSGNYEEQKLQRTFDRPEVRLLRRSTDTGISLVAQNTYYAPVEVAFKLTNTDNVAADVPRSGILTLAPRSTTELVVVSKANAAATMSFQSEFQHLVGDPHAEHRPEQPYRLPYALSTSVPVSQAYPDTITHKDPSSQYAIDFVMPIGTGVYAARAGTVVEVASDFYDAGLDPVVDGPRANIVRVLHDDGTMSLYAHLNWNSIRVVPGQKVARGEYLADSGNTGFTTGPHLHFVVQRNDDGRIVSVPVEFAGAGGAAITVRAGQRYTAY
jgi:murein DD-endopeptidase MepM/ murein hydrolase activator NlpD